VDPGIDRLLIRRLARSAVLLAALGCCWPAARTAHAATDYRFKAYQSNPVVSLGPSVLSDAERLFIAGLPEMRVALVEGGTPPYETVSADGEVAGYQAEVLGYLATTLGLRIKPVILPNWPAVLRAVREGQADMVLTLSVTPERLRYLEFTLGTVPVPTALFARPGNTADPGRSRIAIEREYYTNFLVARLYPQATVVPTDSTAEALRAVSQGQADFYVGSLLEAIESLSRQPVPGIEAREILQTERRAYHFGIRKDWAALAPILNKGISRVRADIDPRALAAAASGLAASAALPKAFAMSPEEVVQLSQRAVWRVGAVRGLAMLNDADVSGAHSGIAAEYTDHVARRLGLAVDVVAFDNVAAMLDALREGRIDLIPFLTRTRERERDFAFTRPYFEMPYMLVARSDAPLYWDLGSLRGKRLALASQHPLRDTLARNHPEIRVIDARDGNEAIDMVARGEADAAVEVRNFANLRVNADSAARLRVVAEVKEVPARFGFALSKASAGLVPLFDRVLDEIPPAERERLLRRWVALDLDPPFPWRRHLPALLAIAATLLLLVAATAWWMRRLAREVQARRRAVEQLDDIGRTMPGVTFRYVLDDKGRVKQTFYSSGTRAFLGAEPGPHQTVLDLVTARLPEQYAQMARRLQTASWRHHHPFKGTSPYKHPDGRDVWLHCEAVHSRNLDGDSVWTGYVVDVSPERELQERLALEASERHVLLASASHELRAPTHTLLLALQAISEQPREPALAKPLGIARDAAQTLAQLLDDVLDTARAKPGAIELRPQDLELRALIHQVRDAHAGALAAKQLGFECRIAGDAPRLVCLDPLRLRQVLTNLLSNATRYTLAGTVVLEVGGHALDDGSAGVQFVVRDTGPGIASERQAQLFEPFGAAPAAKGSTGLGLSICRRLVRAMGGTLTLDSAIGQGTSVRFWLPASMRVGPQRELRRSGWVLLCDDDPVSRMLMAEFLSAAGYALIEVTDGQAALERWRQGDVRLVITDMTMPRLDGASLIEAIRGEEGGRSEFTAIVVCSGNPAPAVVAGAGRPLHDAFLTKPTEWRTLIDTLAALGIRPGSATSP
jgi:two-component system, NarL family, sensor histidine kinase EvgS